MVLQHIFNSLNLHREIVNFHIILKTQIFKFKNMVHFLYRHNAVIAKNGYEYTSSWIVIVIEHVTPEYNSCSRLMNKS